ncbi:hypothetical protein [Paucisalibacillus sp. EB02]|uniref:hypothetical protein n=1 Tax=Paucisalibacillus sp. EB02 TaxID=1347087 RepID=UPI0005A7A588|nr:hypothetical protein [Paucisalibacillus sp. EB02]
MEKGTTSNPILALLGSNPDTKDITLAYGSPEYESRFDKYGKGRQHDYIALGEQGYDKVNETIESYYMISIIKQLNGDRTRVTNRIEN